MEPAHDAAQPLQAGATYTVAVRALCEFTAKQGDLDLRFTPAPTAQEGIAGHAWVASLRGPGYQREFRLGGRYQALEVRGGPMAGIRHGSGSKRSRRTRAGSTPCPSTTVSCIGRS